MKFSAVIRLIRVKQWIKNGFVLGPLIFSRQFLEGKILLHAFLAFVFFCIASSATYILNDINDVERDKAHPIKSKKRPIANGDISVKSAWILYFFLLFLLCFSYVLGTKFVLTIVGYLALNVLYSTYLKHQPVLDIFSIAIGFVLRVVAGAVALPVPLSQWMFITTLCLALYLASIKRRQELEQHGSNSRNVLGSYSISLVDKYAEMSATGAIIFYSLFIITTENKLAITIPLVLFGLFRYWYAVESLDEGESPTDTLMGDVQLLVTCVLWLSISAYILWPK